MVGVNSRCRGPPIQVVFRPASLINFSGHMFAWLYSLTICVVITSVISWNLEQNKRLQRQRREKIRELPNQDWENRVETRRRVCVFKLAALIFLTLGPS